MVVMVVVLVLVVLVLVVVGVLWGPRACCCLLLPAAACCCLLLPAAACCCLLLPAAACCCLLHHAGSGTYRLGPQVGPAAWVMGRVGDRGAPPAAAFRPWAWGQQ